MGYRLSKIYTRTGDKGMTQIANGDKLPKDDIRLHCLGDVDELNCIIGTVLAQPLREPVNSILTQIQHHLFELGGELAIPNTTRITEADVVWLERHIDALNESLPPLKEFILPRGSMATASCHLARAVCRRTERHLVGLNHANTDTPQSQIYINRLSDLLFVLARTIEQGHDATETLWNKRD